MYCYDFFKNGTRCLIASPNDTIKLWNLEENKVIDEVPFKIFPKSITVTNDNKYAAFTYFNYCSIWDLEIMEEISDL